MTFGVLAPVLLFHAWVFSNFLVDDSFILLRYADNLQRGRGLVFNLGERVEGFTSPLLVLLQAAFLRAQVDPTRALGILSGLVLLGLTLRLAWDLTRSRAVTFVAGAVLVQQTALATAEMSSWRTS